MFVNRTRRQRLKQPHRFRRLTPGDTNLSQFCPGLYDQGVPSTQQLAQSFHRL